MHLTVRVISDSGQALTEPSKTFGEDGGTIGRSPEADWTLPDQSLFLSRIHARIFYSAGAFYIEGISTNGIYHIYAAEISPINSPAQLHPGDRLLFGEYEVSIEISGTPDFVFRNTDWGFSTLKLDESLLAVGTITVSEAHGVFPDGTQFNIPEDDDPPESCSVPRDTKKSTVYLAIVKSGSDTKNCFQLLIGSESKDQGPCLGVVRVKELRDDNTILLDDEYIPTVINCQAAPALVRLAEELLGLLHHRGEALAGRAGTARDGSLADVADFLMLQMINRYEPLLDYLLSLQVLHPEELYRLAIEIVGELSTFTSVGMRPPALPTYLHDNLQASFRPVIQGLRQSLSIVMEQAAVSIPLNPRKYGVMIAYFPQALLDSCRLVLAVKGDTTATELRQRVPQDITIGPPEQIRQLVNTAQPGIPIRSLSAAPRQVPFHAGYAYFELALDRHDEWFAAIKRSDALALHLPGTPNGMDVELWAIRSTRPDKPEWWDSNCTSFSSSPQTKSTHESFVLLGPDEPSPDPLSPGQLEESKRPDQDDSRTLTDWDTGVGSASSDEDVQFTVYRPTAVKPLEWYTLLAFAHRSTLPADAAPDELQPIEEVVRQANNILGQRVSQYRTVTQDGNYPVSRAMEITLVPEVPGVEFNPSHRSFLWEETVHREEFRLRAGADMEGKIARGRITVFLGSIILADVSLNIRVDESASLTQERSELSTDRSNAYKKIFASYSHKDSGIIEQFVHYAKALGDEYLLDQTHLRSGEKWSEGLQQMIREANIFQLFWSSDSMRSPFVKHEWEYALSLHRPGFIRPTYWEEPIPCSPEENLPPEALSQLHFQQISFIRAPQSKPLAVDPANIPHQARNGVTKHSCNMSSMRLISPLLWIVVALTFVFVAWIIMKLW